MIWGLHPIDFGILMVCLMIILGMGFWAAKTVHGQSDFFLGGRKMGKTLQFFMNFGNATDPTAAPTMASQVYTRGVSGMWLQLQTLFFTPLFWFTQPWFRRARVITMADLFVDRFNAKSIAAAYAFFNIIVALLLLGVGNLASYSVVEAMLVKPESALTTQEKEIVSSHRELQNLKLRDRTTLSAEERARFAALDNREKAGELRASFAYIGKLEFYIGYNLIVAIYIMIGGLTASALTDSIQGLLILLMSVILIPIGLSRIGGFGALHDIVRPDFFWLTGTLNSNFTWYSVAAITFGSFIQIIGLQHNMSAAGSAKDENTARFGMIVGGFTKRLVLICWMLCGLLAVAIFTGPRQLAQADLAWGTLSNELLPVGLIGVMLSGMLLGHMSAVGLTSIAVSGLVVRNLYSPVVKDQSQKHYLLVGQIIVGTVLLASVFVAYGARDLQSLWQRLITFNTFFGAVVFLLFFWRRLTVPAIMISFFIWMILELVIPLAVQYTPALREHPALLLQTQATTRVIQVPAKEADVQAGRAAAINEPVRTSVTIDPVPVFFDGKIMLKDAENPNAGRYGSGPFLMENLVLYYPLRAVGLRMENFNYAGVTTTRWLFAGFFPFISLIVFSLLTKPSAAERAPAFYAKMKTPVAPTPELDHEEVQKSVENPGRFDGKKLFPGTNWEFGKWTRQDYLGVFGSYGVVVAILGILWLVLHVGKPWPWW